MLTWPDVPWWAVAYLVLNYVMLLWAFSPNPHDRTISVLGVKIAVSGVVDFISVVFLSLIVFAFFDAGWFAFLGIALVPMTVSGALWEFLSTKDGLDQAEAELESDLELSEAEKKWLLNVSLFFVNIMTVPGYIMGLVLCGRIITA